MAERKFPDWATTFNPDIGNGDPNIIDPGATKQQSGWVVEKPLLQTMNWLQNLFGHFIRANNEFKLRDDGYEAEAGEIVEMDNTSGPVQGLLPANPVDRQWVSFGGALPYTTNGVNISGNGKNIMQDGTTDVDLDIDNYMFIFVYDEIEDLWIIRIGTQKGVL